MHRLTFKATLVILTLILFCFFCLPTLAKEQKSTKTDSWIDKVGTIYLQEKIPAAQQFALLRLLESRLGIEPDGKLNMIKAWNAQSQLEKAAIEYGNSGNNENFAYMEDKVNLLGYNYIYFEICTVYKERYAKRFIRYFENGFHPNRSMFIKEAYYYKILYYYLYLMQDQLIGKINTAVAQLNQSPSKAPSFDKNDIRSFSLLVKVAAELDNLRLESKGAEKDLFKKSFSTAEQNWIQAAVEYFTNPETHEALCSYEWFNSNIPLDLTAMVISHSIQRTWKQQAMAYRASLPLMLFADKASTQTSVEKLLDATLNKLKLDNREVDIMVLSALKTWLTKQINHGINVEDRIKYSQVLSELEVCPSGWTFFNLFSCRGKTAKLKEHAEAWDVLSYEKKQSLFENEISTLYFEAVDNITSVFNDLEKIFGKDKIFGSQLKENSVNYIFHKYRGEINYYFEYIKLGLVDKGAGTTQMPLSNLKNNCLYDFKAAFIKADDQPVNHINLLKAFNLLFRELTRQGKLNEIQQYEEEIEALVSGPNKLGAVLAHSENNLYDIYRLIAYSYISSNNGLQYHALDVAKKSFDLAKAYYKSASREQGYILGDKLGALDISYTQTDDYERQFEFYQDIANKLGKKIHLLLPEEDIALYNRMQNIRNPKGLLL